jgi:hypothetical protein
MSIPDAFANAMQILLELLDGIGDEPAEIALVLSSVFGLEDEEIADIMHNQLEGELGLYNKLCF